MKILWSKLWTYSHNENYFLDLFSIRWIKHQAFGIFFCPSRWPHYCYQFDGDNPADHNCLLLGKLNFILLSILYILSDITTLFGICLTNLFWEKYNCTVFNSKLNYFHLIDQVNFLNNKSLVVHAHDNDRQVYCPWIGCGAEADGLIMIAL